MICVYCGEDAEVVFEGNSLCENHLTEQMEMRDVSK